MAKLKVETFQCPYAECVWPKCMVDRDQLIRHTLCTSEVERTQDKILRRFAVKPRKTRKQS